MKENKNKKLMMRNNNKIITELPKPRPASDQTSPSRNTPVAGKHKEQPFECPEYPGNTRGEAWQSTEGMSRETVTTDEVEWCEGGRRAACPPPPPPPGLHASPTASHSETLSSLTKTIFSR